MDPAFGQCCRGMGSWRHDGLLLDDGPGGRRNSGVPYPTELNGPVLKGAGDAACFAEAVTPGKSGPQAP